MRFMAKTQNFSESNLLARQAAEEEPRYQSTRKPFVVVVAVAGGRSSVDAFHKAVDIFHRRPMTAFHIVHVRPDPELHRIDKLYFGSSHALEHWARLEEAEAAASREILARFGGMAADECVDYSTVELCGDPAQTLKEYCQRVDAEVLVVGALKRFLRPAIHRPTFLWCHQRGVLDSLRVKG